MSYEGEGEGRHHHHHHERRNEDQDSYGGGFDQQLGQGGYGQGGQYGGGSSYGDQGSVQTDVYQEVKPTSDGRILEDTKVEVTKHKHEGEAAGLGGLAAGAFAMYEAHEAKKDPEHARRHKLEEELAGGAAVGAEGFALYEHHEKKGSQEELKKLEEESSGEKKHHWF